MQNQIYPQVWIQLPKATKDKLVEVFEIPRTGVTEVKDQELVSDGHTAADLMAITNEKMNAYIGSEETFHRAWEVTLAKVHSELNPPVMIIQEVGGKMGIADIPESPIVAEPVKDEPMLEKTPEVVDVKSDESVPFCDTCAAPRAPHYKKCPKFTPTNA